jgi:hypothetical protein
MTRSGGPVANSISSRLRKMNQEMSETESELRVLEWRLCSRGCLTHRERLADRKASWDCRVPGRESPGISVFMESVGQC